MKAPFAVTITRREWAELLETDAPEPLGDFQVRGRTVSSLISAGTELASSYQGEHFPSRPGYAAVFRVEEIGAQVQNIRVGELALCAGPHRSYQQCEERNLWRVPDGVPAPHASFARLMGVAMTTLVTTAARPPGRVVVVGLGPVGHLAAQIFKACGYKVLACDPVETRRALAAAQEVEVAAAIPSDHAEWAQKTALVLECSGHEAAVLHACRLVAKGGEVVLIGVPWRRCTELFAHELLHAIFHRYVVLRSGWEWELPMEPVPFGVGSIHQNIGAALGWIEQNRVCVNDLYGEYSPHECQRAYDDLSSGRAKSLAAVFDWTRL